MRRIIDCFRGKYGFLSNFHMEKNNKTSEHLFQAMKTKSHKWKRAILNAKSPTLAKKLGKKAPLRKRWKKKRKKVMEIIVFCKFYFIEKNRIKLLDTDSAVLIEGNWWHDNYWGDCKWSDRTMKHRCERCKNIKGKNNLGKILMQTRKEIKNDYAE